MHRYDEYTRTFQILSNASTRVSQTRDQICYFSMFDDVIIRFWHKIALFGVPITWCASAYNEEDLAGESWYTRFWCL